MFRRNYCQLRQSQSLCPIIIASYGKNTFSTNAFTKIERKWQQKWAKQMENNINSMKKDLPKYYCLAMFPYPSGQLHIGHVRVYAISDTIARLKRMQGYNVLHPMGWDAFGLPAENAAIERGIAPADWTVDNISQAKEQLKALGILFNWDREVTTCSPSYYKWTQWLFLQMYKNNLAYQKEALVNWDPIDHTVLANEQVDADGRSWRSGALVEQKALKQWFIKITDYADRLLDDLDKLSKWPDAVKRMQAAWIGRSQGSELPFHVDVLGTTLQVFTTRADTIFGVSYLSIAPDSTVAKQLLAHVPHSHTVAVNNYLNERNNFTENVKAKAKERAKTMQTDKSETDEESNGVFTGVYATHPLTKELIPIYLADYVLAHVGTGVVMGVPAHDDRDWRFAKRHCLPIRRVINSAETDGMSSLTLEQAFTDRGVLVSSDQFSGMTSSAAIKEITDFLGGKFVNKFRLRDWLVSRQRYWGAPVPIIHCSKCGLVPVPDEDLPVVLPTLSETVISNNLRGGGDEGSQSPLARVAAWHNCNCPKCNGPAKRDTDTLDTFVDSSWYFLRYCDAQNLDQIFSEDSVRQWLMKTHEDSKNNKLVNSTGVDIYIGGIEHAILHLLYSRFLTKFLYDQNMVPVDEPFHQLLAQGMVLGRTHKAKDTLRYLQPHEYEQRVLEDGSTGMIEKATGLPCVTVWEKMSKSKYNGVDPVQICTTHGADVTRLVVLFKAPPVHELEWEENDLAGQARWLGRIGSLIDNAVTQFTANFEPLTEKSNEKLRSQLLLQLHGTIQRVTDALTVHQAFNVAIAELMKFSNILGSSELEPLRNSNCPLYIQSLTVLIKMLAPMAPHSTSEWFERMNKAGLIKGLENIDDIHACPWPSYDASVLEKAEIKIVLQVQGKVRDTIAVSTDVLEDKDYILDLAMKSVAIQKHTKNKTIHKVILVAPKKTGGNGVLNIVAS